MRRGKPSAKAAFCGLVMHMLMPRAQSAGFAMAGRRPRQIFFLTYATNPSPRRSVNLRVLLTNGDAFK